MLHEQTPVRFIIYFMLYGGVALAFLVACAYLCLRRGNAFAADVTPPVRLRRWAAAFFAVVFLSHVWWFLFYIYSSDLHSVSYLVASTLDCVGLFTTIAGTLFAMLQDRRRPVWPITLATIPYAVLLALSTDHPDVPLLDMAVAYIILLYVLFTVYMTFAVRKYGRWLRDYYTDLERKEVWVSYVLVIGLLLGIITYGFDAGDMAINYIVQFIALLLVGLLLWRVETLPLLEEALPQDKEPSIPLTDREKEQGGGPANVNLAYIKQLLAVYCVDTQLYLQHDLTLRQLAQAVGTNRFYLSQYFTSQGTTYNAYINDLRIDHFKRLYREAVAAGQPITAQQLASASGFTSYSTFGYAFKQRMGQSAKAWMRKMAS